MTGVSVVICCHNSRARVLPALQALSLQTASIDWEIIAVDNNSSDNTAECVTETWKKIGASVPLRVITEKTPGLKYARESGIRAARFDIVLFCDDDNRPSPGYIKKVFDVFTADRSIGVVGGLGIAVSSVQLPDWFSKFQNLFAVGPPVAEAGELSLGMGYVYGAGMALRKSVWAELERYGFSGVSVDRKGNELTGGHDVEMGHAVRLIGYKVIFEPTLTFDHAMDPDRLNRTYLLSLVRGSSSNFVPFVYFILLQQRASGWVAFSLSYMKRVVSEGLQCVRLTLFPMKDREMNDVMRTMAWTSFVFFLKNFHSALGYFRHVRGIKSISEASK